MERLWNYVHYTIYLFENRASFFFRKIINLAFYPITKISYLREGLKKRGSSFEEIDKIARQPIENRQYGLNVTMAGIHMGGLLVFTEFSLFNFLQIIINKSLTIWDENVNSKYLFIIGLLVLPAVVNYFLLWKDDRYLVYFKKFEKESKIVKRKWAWISFGVIIGIILFFIASIFLVANLVYQKT